MKKLISVLLTAALAFGIGACALAEEETVPAKLDMSKWQYEAADDVYWQVGLSYAATPADSGYETMGIFVPGAYFNAQDNGDGTYTLIVRKVGD